MSRIAYVNGQYVNHADAGIHVEDRAVQFADGVYEVCPVRNRTIIDRELHIERYRRSLGELAIEPPMTDASLRVVLGETVRRNKVVNGLLYFQVSRGIAPRNHIFPGRGVARSLIVTARNVRPAPHAHGIAVITLPDIRWKRVDIKSISLLPNVLAREQARLKGASEAWLVDDAGFVTEGATSNAWIVTREGALVTREAENAVLRGITRTIILEIAGKLGLEFDQRPFTVAEAKQAAEAFASSASLVVTSVVKIDQTEIANGRPGPVAHRLNEALEAFISAQSRVSPPS